MDGIVVIAEIARAQARNDTVLVQKIAGGGDQLGPSQRQLAVVGQAQNGLDGPFSIRGGTDNDRTPDILKGRGDDFGRRRRTPVNQHDDRYLRRQAVAGCLKELAARRMAAHGRDDRPLRNKDIRQADGLIKQPTGVASRSRTMPRSR